MTWWNTLRGRLIAAMLLILIVAVGVSSLMDRLDAGKKLPEAEEPFQDALVLAGFCLPALVLVWIVSSWSLRPLARISDEARQIGPQKPVARLSTSNVPGEIVPLVEAVNGALERMAQAFDAERRFTENAAHELRTPLAVLGLRLQRARHAGTAPGADLAEWGAIEKDLEQINRLVSQMLDLARKENEGRLHENAPMPVVNLSRIAREACAAVLPIVERHGRTLDVAIPEAMNVCGNAQNLHDALRNMLENAIVHGRGRITMDAHLDQAAKCYELRVSDEGAGFDAASLPKVFERFEKSTISQGTGLGLAIVRQVARNHGGDIIAFPGPPGRIELRVPSAPPGRDQLVIS